MKLWYYSCMKEKPLKVRVINKDFIQYGEVFEAEGPFYNGSFGDSWYYICITESGIKVTMNAENLEVI